MRYYFYILSPKNGLRVVAKGSDGQERQIDVLAKLKQLKRQVNLSLSDGAADFGNLHRDAEDAERLRRTRCSAIGEAFVCKMPGFYLDADHVESFLKDIRKHKSFVFDLRGNPGGGVDTLEGLLGGFFDHDVTIGTRVGRKEMKPQVAKHQHEAFSGKVVVLVDSQSSSAS